MVPLRKEPGFWSQRLFECLHQLGTSLFPFLLNYSRLLLKITMCLGQFCLRGEIRVKKSVASPFRRQRTMRTQTDGKTESRSHTGTGCLPLWQTNPPIWRLLITRMEMKREDKRAWRRVRTNTVSLCLQANRLYSWICDSKMDIHRIIQGNITTIYHSDVCIYLPMSSVWVSN